MVDLYRKNAGAIVINKDKKVLLCRRLDITDAWQFPQGGIEEGESPSLAAKRELYEETSIKNVKLIKTLDNPIRYHFPQEILEKMQKRGFSNLGQDIYWSFFLFEGNDDEINLQTNEPEFSEFKWTTMKDAVELVVDFKKEAYLIAQIELDNTEV